jgi:hypothetical protein
VNCVGTSKGQVWETCPYLFGWETVATFATGTSSAQVQPGYGVVRCLTLNRTVFRHRRVIPR